VLTIQVCVGSSCFLRGSKNIVAEIEHLISHYQLDDLVELKGSFCFEQCSEGVTIMIGDNTYKVKPDEVTDLFEKEVFAILYGEK
jgi:NADH:ubiquinone oxidoreductase subunit E